MLLIIVNKSSEERLTRKEVVDLQQRWAEQRKELKNENLRLKGQVMRVTAKYNQIKEKEMSLQLANRLMADVIKTYADRESSMFVTLRTLWLNYRTTESSEELKEATVDLDAD